MYPNPVRDQLIIETSGGNETVTYEIYNSFGQIVQKGSFIEKTIIQISSFSTGIYFVKLLNGNSTEVKKIVKE